MPECTGSTPRPNWGHCTSSYRCNLPLGLSKAIHFTDGSVTAASLQGLLCSSTYNGRRKDSMSHTLTMQAPCWYPVTINRHSSDSHPTAPVTAPAILYIYIYIFENIQRSVITSSLFWRRSVISCGRWSYTVSTLRLRHPYAVPVSRTSSWASTVTVPDMFSVT